MRKLCYSEDTFAIVSFPLLFGHTCEEAEVVFFYCFLSAHMLKIALGTVPVKNDLGLVAVRILVVYYRIVCYNSNKRMGQTAGYYLQGGMELVEGRQAAG